MVDPLSAQVSFRRQRNAIFPARGNRGKNYMPVLAGAAMLSGSAGFTLSRGAGAAMVAAGFIASCGAMPPDGAGAILGADIDMGDCAMPPGAAPVCAHATAAPASEIPAKAIARLKIFGITKRLREVAGAGLARHTKHPRLLFRPPMPFVHVFNAWNRRAKTGMVMPLNGANNV
jgi:hypothetical protein